MQKSLDRLIVFSSCVLVLTILSGCLSIAKSYVWTHDKIDGIEAVIKNTTTTTTLPATVATVKPSIINDDPKCALIVKYQGGEPRNEGQVTYVAGVVTMSPFGNANPVCLQYNDPTGVPERGEVTVFKDKGSKGERVETLPAIGINKIVVWYE